MHVVCFVLQGLLQSNGKDGVEEKGKSLVYSKIQSSLVSES